MTAKTILAVLLSGLLLGCAEDPADKRVRENIEKLEKAHKDKWEPYRPGHKITPEEMDIARKKAAIEEEMRQQRAK